MESLFRVDLNPFGILYNPLSVSTAMKRLLLGTPFSEEDLVFDKGLYHSLMHHGQFSASEKDRCLQNISERFERAVINIKQSDLILVTFGSAYVYQWLETGEVVGNCHKLPAHQFHRFRLSVKEIEDEWTDLITMLMASRPGVQLMFTVSPVRHWKDGAHDNQLSKSVLHLAIEGLQKHFPQTVSYFPAYEVLMDELRDYRFYGEDMIHPSSLAVDYLWERFGDVFFSSETRMINEEWKSIRKALSHRPLYPGTESHEKFKKDTSQKLENFRKKYPDLVT